MATNRWGAERLTMIPWPADTVSFEKLEVGIGATGRLLGTSLLPMLIIVENVIGTSEDDFIAGDTRDNVIEGGDGADNLDGGVLRYNGR